MKKNPTFIPGYSGCPNDTFIFKAIARQLIDIQKFNADIKIRDVERLNQNAGKGCHAPAKHQVAAFGNRIDPYALLRTGSAPGPWWEDKARDSGVIRQNRLPLFACQDHDAG